MYQKQDEIWLEEVCEKIKQKITWVSENPKIKFRIQRLKVYMMTGVILH